MLTIPPSGGVILLSNADHGRLHDGAQGLLLLLNGEEFAFADGESRPGLMT